MSKSGNDRDKKLISEVIAMAEAYSRDQDDERFNHHLDIILDADDPDDVLMDAMPIIMARYPDLAINDFVSAVLDRSGGTILEDDHDDRFYGSTLFAIPFRGDPKVMQAFVFSDALKEFEKSFTEKGYAKEGVKVVMFPVPQSVKDINGVSPKWMRILSLTLGASVVPGIESKSGLKDFIEQLKEEAGDHAWMSEGDHWLLLGAEVQEMSVDSDEADSLLDENRPTVMNEWHQFVSSKILPEGIRCQLPNALSVAKSIMSASMIDLALKTEAKLMNLPEIELYDEIVLTPNGSQLLVSAKVGDIELGPVSTDVSLFVSDLGISMRILKEISRKLTKVDELVITKTIN